MFYIQLLKDVNCCKIFNIFDRQSKEEGKKPEVKKMEKKRG